MVDPLLGDKIHKSVNAILVSPSSMHPGHKSGYFIEMNPLNSILVKSYYTGVSILSANDTHVSRLTTLSANVT